MANIRRLFVSIEVPRSTKEKIGEFATLIPRLQPHPSENFHVTVKFLGEVGENQLEDMPDILSDITARTPRFKIGFEGLKFEESRLRFLVKNPQPIMTLRSDVEGAFKKIGLNRQDPLLYEPHITLGKIKTAPLEEPVFDYGSLTFTVGHIVLFKTVRGEKTAQFIPLKEFPLI